jgi:parvulin-like peptidyl-prolyl isomerase
VKTIQQSQLQDELIQINERLQQQDELFDLVDDEDLIEAIIYEQKALRSRFSYLIKKAREESVNMSFIERQYFERTEPI